MRVKNFPLYEVYRTGEVVSNHRKTPLALTPRRDKKGYLCVTLCNSKTDRRSVRVHRLVAEHFLKNPLSLPCVRHLDNNPANNKVENLAWGTYKDNEADKKLHGTYDLRKSGKLDKLTREVIFALRQEGWTQQRIASWIGVSRPTVSRFLNKKTWVFL